MTSSFAPPGESASVLWEEQAQMIGFSLMCISYGMVVVLFFQCADLLLHNSLRKNRRSWFLLGYLCATFTAATGALGINVKYNQMAFIDNRNYPGGPTAFTVADYGSLIPLIGNSLTIAVTWLTDGLLLYRCFVIWNVNYWMLLLPGLMYAGSVASSILFLHSIGPQGAGFWSSKAVTIGTAYWSLSISLNIIITILICAKLFITRKRTRAITGNRPDNDIYTSLSAILIESAALYTIWALIFLIAYTRKMTALHSIVISALCEVQTMATFLIILRVAQGRAWSGETTSKVTTLEFNNPKASSSVSVRLGATSIGGAGGVSLSMQEDGISIDPATTPLELKFSPEWSIEVT